MQAEVVLPLYVNKHPLTTQCYNTHVSYLYLYFSEVFHKKFGREELEVPNVKLQRFVFPGSYNLQFLNFQIVGVKYFTLRSSL